MALLLQERLPLIQLLTVDHFVCEHYYPLQQDVTRGDFHFFYTLLLQNETAIANESGLYSIFMLGWMIIKKMAKHPVRVNMLLFC